ncbi:zonular occludens toxin domain-containing protein [Xanthomonas sp. XNM01]|uniref:zonular occludens toxin domain-containing protein n=1 Tax=Xanthomonas sp. XNM01 TaxID=2769289 RepID=UPI00178480BB|nr:zonular occludens toxin [Xanthomonas sp. XNM01]
MIGDTASISLLTGLPGSGKSLRMTQRIVELVEKGEHVYTCNINGISVPGITPWEDPTKWRDLPAGAVLFVDEAQQYFRARRAGEVPEYISAMETIRHSGVRLVLATQQPNYLDTHLRGLVGFHEHLLRQSGKNQTFIFRNHQVMDEVRMGLKRVKGLYDHEKWSLPEKYFKFYKSAELHTVKYRMPALLKKVLIVGPLALMLFLGVFGMLFWKAYMQSNEAEGMSKTPPAAASAKPTASASAGGSPRAAVRTGEEYVEAITPLVADVPWSAPGYIGRDFKSDPHMYCMSTENSCRCVTEQNTRVVVRDDVCRDVARWGEPYNPFKAPRQEVEREPAQERQQTAPAVAQRPREDHGAGVLLGSQDRAQGTFPEVASSTTRVGAL